MSRRSRITGVVLCCLAPAVLPASAAAPAIASAASARTVRIGTAPPRLPAGARTLGAVAAATRLHVTVALEPRNPAALASFAQAVSTPGSIEYGRYLTPAEFARRFGATAAAIAAVRDDLRSSGLTPGRMSANGLSIPVTATANALEEALSVKLERVAVRGGARAIIATAAPAVSGAVAPLVQAVIGLSTVGSPHPLTLRARSRRAATTARARPHVATGGPQPCAAATSAASGASAYTADQIASAYGFSGLYHAGDEGQGQTIALYELEPDNPSDIAAFQACYGTHASVSYVPVDGGAGTGDGSGEAALDIEDAISLAPKANILVDQAPNSDSNGPGSGPYDNFSAIISQDRAQVVSASWGQCESMEGAADAGAESTLFEEAATQGQTIVSAAGDDGSEDCFNGNPVLGGTQLAVDDPASQPYVTGVGGTTLSALGPRPTETTWNNGNGVVVSALVEPGAGGGGLSSLWSMPSYQSDAPSSVRVLSAPAGGGCGAARCREVPDVSADADPNTGYLIYYNGDGAEPTTPSGWQGIGGTSASAPLWAALIALANASSTCAGTNIGFANPGLYRAAATGYAADFNDVRTGNNDFTGTNNGEYPAGAGYDLATGLGTPNASSLAPALCAQTLRIQNPGSKSTTVHSRVSLHLRTLGDGAGKPSFSAHGLPPGLSIAPGTGAITGKPRSIGTHQVTVTAHNNGGLDATASFTWTVGAAPALSRVALTGTGDRRRLRFTVTAGRGAPALRSVTISSATGFRLTSRVSLAGRPRHTTRLARGKLLLTLAAPGRRISITVIVRITALRAPTIKVLAADAFGNSTSLRARPRVG
jgi:subtilase family serine protease